MIPKIQIFAILLIFSGLHSMAQSEEKINQLFGKKWVINSYDISGKNFPATDIGEHDCTIFYPDHSVTTVDNGVMILSKWKYDEAKNTMTLYSEETKVTSKMKIFNLTGNEFVWETANPEGMTMTIHMSGIKDK